MEWGAGFASGSSGFQSCPPSETWVGGGRGDTEGTRGGAGWKLGAHLQTSSTSQGSFWLDGEESPEEAQDLKKDVPRVPREPRSPGYSISKAKRFKDAAGSSNAGNCLTFFLSSFRAGRFGFCLGRSSCTRIKVLLIMTTLSSCKALITGCI